MKTTAIFCDLCGHPMTSEMPAILRISRSGLPSDIGLRVMVQESKDRVADVCECCADGLRIRIRELSATYRDYHEIGETTK